MTWQPEKKREKIKEKSVPSFIQWKVNTICGNMSTARFQFNYQLSNIEDSNNKVLINCVKKLNVFKTRGQEKKWKEDLKIFSDYIEDDCKKYIAENNIFLTEEKIIILNNETDIVKKKLMKAQILTECIFEYEKNRVKSP